jgi:hypothetical protein
LPGRNPKLVNERLVLSGGVLGHQTDKTTVTTLSCISCEAVANIVTDVVSDALDDGRCEALCRVVVEEYSYRKGKRCVTVFADYDRQDCAIWAHTQEQERRDVRGVLR